jgi:probable HAF family extracellular repeat protein
MRSRDVICGAALAAIAGCASGGATPAGSGALPNASHPVTQAARPRLPATYAVQTFGTFGGTASSAASINERGWITGSANLSGDTSAHAALWGNGAAKDLGTLGGPSSAIAWPNLNNFGLLAGITETPAMDPYGEPWSCSDFFPAVTPSLHVCVGFSWRNDVMRPLPTLGGPDGYAAGTNDWGNIVGWAEDTTMDPTCDDGQVLQFEPVMWDAQGRVHQLPTLAGDPDGAATAINDVNQIVGISGICDQAVGRFTAIHVVEWDRGNVRKLFNVSSVSWNTPTAINLSGGVVGFVNIPGSGDEAGNLQPIAFVWTKRAGITDIRPLGSDAYSIAEGINDEGDVVGVSYGAGFATARAFIYHNGTAYDMNQLVAAGSPYLLVANAIDDRGDVVGQASTSGGEALAFEATPPWFAAGRRMKPSDVLRPNPIARKPVALSARLRFELLKRYGGRYRP